MPHRHKVTPTSIGQVRIYMTTRERRARSRLKGILPARPLYQELIAAAKADGIMNATAHLTHYGYSGGGKVQAHGAEVANADTPLYVELIGPTDQLELFCRTHGALLTDKLVVHKTIEHWHISRREDVPDLVVVDDDDDAADVLPTS